MGDDYYNSADASGYDDQFNDAAAYSGLNRSAGRAHPLQPQGVTAMRRYTDHPTQGLSASADDQAMRFIPRPYQRPAGMGLNVQRMYANGGHHSS